MSSYCSSDVKKSVVDNSNGNNSVVGNIDANSVVDNSDDNNSDVDNSDDNNSDVDNSDDNNSVVETSDDINRDAVYNLFVVTDFGCSGCNDIYPPDVTVFTNRREAYRLYKEIKEELRSQGWDYFSVKYPTLGQESFYQDTDAKRPRGVSINKFTLSDFNNSVVDNSDDN